MQIGVEINKSVDNKRIFVLESDEIIRAALQFMLHDENETHEIPSVEEAYRKAETWKPDLILLGLSLVKDHGVSLIGELVSRMPGIKVAIIKDAITDAESEALAGECLKNGAHSLLVKPFTIESVRRKVDILLGRRTSLGIQVQVT